MLTQKDRESLQSLFDKTTFSKDWVWFRIVDKHNRVQGKVRLNSRGILEFSYVEKYYAKDEDEISGDIIASNNFDHLR